MVKIPRLHVEPVHSQLHVALIHEVEVAIILQLFDALPRLHVAPVHAAHTQLQVELAHTVGTGVVAQLCAEPLRAYTVRTVVWLRHVGTLLHSPAVHNCGRLHGLRSDSRGRLLIHGTGPAQAVHTTQSCCTTARTSLPLDPDGIIDIRYILQGRKAET